MSECYVFMTIKGKSIFLWTTNFDRRFCFQLTNCLIILESQFEELCGLEQIALA